MKDFFTDGSPFLRHPLLTTERTRQEIDFLVGALALAPAARVLDLGCGFGRHSIELAHRGYRPLGIDPAPAMIKAASMKAQEAGVEVAFKQIAAEEFTPAEPFGAAICLFTTLGQVAPASQHDNRGLLATAAKSLKADGRFALEIPQKQPTLDALKPDDRFGDDTRYTQVQRSYHAQSGIVTEQFHLVTPSRSQTYDLRYRLFTRTEVSDLLTSAGLRILHCHAGYTCADLTDDSPFMLFICAT